MQETKLTTIAGSLVARSHRQVIHGPLSSPAAATRTGAVGVGRRCLSAGLLVGVVLGTLGLCPARARANDDLFGRDKALHFGASAAIALAGYGGTALVTEAPRPRLLVGGGLALLAGIGKELADRYTGGDPSWKDLGWDVVGTATGVAVGWLIDRGLRKWYGVLEPAAVAEDGPPAHLPDRRPFVRSAAAEDLGELRPVLRSELAQSNERP